MMLFRITVQTEYLFLYYLKAHLKLPMKKFYRFSSADFRETGIFRFTGFRENSRNRIIGTEQALDNAFSLQKTVG